MIDILLILCISPMDAIGSREVIVMDSITLDITHEDPALDLKRCGEVCRRKKFDTCKENRLHYSLYMI